MRYNIIKLGLLVLVSIIAIDTASANPGFNIVVTPITNSVMQGGTAQFSVTVTAIDTLTEEEFVELSVIDLGGTPITWNTRFSDNLFKLGPVSDASRREKTVTLEIDVPAGASVGDHIQKVRGDGYAPDLNDLNKPDRFLGSLESSEFPIIVVVTQIPEFSSIAMPVISVVGLMLLFQRRKGK